MTEEKPTYKKRIPVPFFLTLNAYPAAGSFNGLSSDMITFPYKIVKVQAHFRDDAANNLQVWCYVATNRNIGTTPPPDNKILGFYSPTPYLIGEGEIVTVDTDVYPAENEKYLKVYFCNFNAYAMTGYCIITIESLEGVSPEQEVLIGVGGDESKYTYEQWAKIYGNRTHAIYDQTLDLLKGSPPWFNVVALVDPRGNKETANTWAEDAANIATMTSFFRPNMNTAEFFDALKLWFSAANGLMTKYSIANIAGEVSGIGLINFTRDLVDRDEKMWGICGEMGKINQTVYDIALNRQVEYMTNEYFAPEIPDTQQLINMVIKEKITLDLFKTQMKKRGFTTDWSQLIWDAHFYAPDFQTVKQAIWRESIKHDEIPDMLKRVDLDPFYNNKVWYSLLYEIPPYPDLINMRVKEVITQTDFAKAIQAHGYYDPWASRLWDAHFSPATFSDFLTAMRRKLSVNIPVAEGTPVSHTFGLDPAKDIEVVKALSVLADYDPRYWDFFQTRIYNDPSPRMSMWAYETGTVAEPQLRDVVHRYGYTPDTEKWFGDMLVHFQERPWITRYLTALQAAYINNAITPEDLKARVRAIPRNEEIANWMIKVADVRKEIAAKGTTTEEQKLVSIPELKKAYTFGLMNEDNFRTELMSRGFTLLDVDLLISIMHKETEIADVGGKKEGLTVAEYFDAYRYQEISEDDLKMQLMLKGLTLDQVNILINTKKKKWLIGGVEGGEA